MVPMSVVLVALALAASAPGVAMLTVDDCPVNLKRDNYLHVYGDLCYEFVMYKSVEFEEAQLNCKNNGGSMVKIPNSGVQMFLQGKLRATYFQTTPVWIGLTDHNSDNTWEWVVDGTEATAYDNWAPGQPGVAHNLGFEDCAAMDPTENGQWHDYRCTHLLFLDFGHPYICQYAPRITKTTNRMTTITMQTKTTPTMMTSTPTMMTSDPTMMTTTSPKMTSTTGMMTTGDGTPQPTTMPPTTMPPTTMPPTTMPPTTMPPTTMPPTTMPTTTMPPTTMPPTTPPPTTSRKQTVMTSQVTLGPGR